MSSLRILTVFGSRKPWLPKPWNDPTGIVNSPNLIVSNVSPSSSLNTVLFVAIYSRSLSFFVGSSRASNICKIKQNIQENRRNIQYFFHKISNYLNFFRWLENEITISCGRIEGRKVNSLFSSSGLSWFYIFYLSQQKLNLTFLQYVARNKLYTCSLFFKSTWSTALQCNLIYPIIFVAFPVKLWYFNTFLQTLLSTTTF